MFARSNQAQQLQINGLRLGNSKKKRVDERKDETVEHKRIWHRNDGGMGLNMDRRGWRPSEPGRKQVSQKMRRGGRKRCCKEKLTKTMTDPDADV